MKWTPDAPNTLVQTGDWLAQFLVLLPAAIPEQFSFLSNTFVF